jgi:hypothetical protein
MKNSQRGSSALFTIALVLIGIIAGGGVYLFYSQAAGLKETVFNESQARSALEATLTTTTAERDTLLKKVAELSCETKWENDACIPIDQYVSFTLSTTTGVSPLKIGFTVRVPDTSFVLDYGDGSTALLANNSCKKDEDDLCVYTFTHTYTSKTATEITARLTRGESDIVSRSIQVSVR